MKNKTLAIVLAPDATPVNPKNPAMTDMTKKMMAHLITDVPFLAFACAGSEHAACQATRHGHDLSRDTHFARDA
jgi:hypothetical protein